MPDQQMAEEIVSNSNEDAGVVTVGEVESGHGNNKKSNHVEGNGTNFNAYAEVVTVGEGEAGGNNPLKQDGQMEIQELPLDQKASSQDSTAVGVVEGFCISAFGHGRI